MQHMLLWAGDGRYSYTHPRQPCWQKKQPSWTQKGASPGTSWSLGCERSQWRSCQRHGPACPCRQASPPGSKRLSPQAWSPQEARCRCSAELEKESMWRAEQCTTTCCKLKEVTLTIAADRENEWHALSPFLPQ